MMKSPEIRQKFFEFFKHRGHEIVPSSSLIPAQDPTLLFANAGMNQFKDVFLGKEKRSYTRATSIQKCMRAGGKHNDLDNVGFTKRHLTFFEMMGNFSFGDYFKEDAIKFAWEFLTVEMHLPLEKLHVTVFETDDEAYDIWLKKMGIPAQRIHRLGAKENFWQMGDTGPCGPCTEIHIDRGPAFGCADCGPACDCDRFLEIWNLVFMQFDRQADGTDKPLKQTGVDTGMGLERLCVVVQNKDSVYETDLFTPIIKKIEQLSGVTYATASAETKAAFHVLADHARSSSLLISDGCAPSNEGRGYVLRKVIRRAALFTQKLSDKNFFPELGACIVQELGTIYPDLLINKQLISMVLLSEVEKFSSNLTRGQAILADYFEANKASTIISGQQAFKLYDTYGFPLELTILMAQDHGFTVDSDGFTAEMEKQQELSSKKETDAATSFVLPEGLTTEFVGYDQLGAVTTITALAYADKVTKQAHAGSSCWLFTQHSPFYAACGGQEADQGWVIVGHHEIKVQAIQKFDTALGVYITTPVELKTGDQVTLAVDSTLRENTTRNHTATHMLQAALMNLFGKHIKQAGSQVNAECLRFDFTYHENLSTEQIKQVEDLVNEKITENIPLHTQVTTYKDATNRGVIAFFGDKYNPDSVRVVEIPTFSAELCGGTHVRRTGDIGCFKITEVTALSAGHRRIVAVTGSAAVKLFQTCFNDLKELSHHFKIERNSVVTTMIKQSEQLKALHTELKHLKKELLTLHIPEWEQAITEIHGIPYLFIMLEEAAHEDMKEVSTQLMRKKPGFYFIVSTAGSGSSFLCSLDKQFADRVNLKEFSTILKEKHGLQGGGGSNLALQGGGKKCDASLKTTIETWLKNR
jgi:alanyl-tRNA synthetase